MRGRPAKLAFPAAGTGDPRGGGVRKLLVALAAVALVLLGALLPLVMPDSCPVTREAF